MYYTPQINTEFTGKKEVDYKRALKTVIWLALVLRLLFLVIMLFWDDNFDVIPYCITDDKKYDILANRYLNRANELFDTSVINGIVTEGYAAPFWPWVVCYVSYFFQSLKAVRYLNIALSCSCIPLVFELTRLISKSESTALFAAKLYAYMPYPLMFCCFPTKDVFLTFGVLVTLLLLVKLQCGEKVGKWHWIAVLLLLWAMLYTRGGVTEFLLLIVGTYLGVHFIQKKKIAYFVLLLLAMAVFLVFFGESIFEAFSTKLDVYFYTDREETTISFVRMDEWYELYKLPFTYLFAMINPLRTQWIGRSSNVWMTWISSLNVSAFPIAIGNFLYLFFSKKKNLLFYITTLAMYCAVIILSLGVFRHYFFLLPILYINYALFYERATETMKQLVAIGSVLLYIGILLLSVL